MKYFKGDIVEIVTSNYKSYSDVPQGSIGYYENQNEPVPFIGQRFRVYSEADQMVNRVYGSYINSIGNQCLCCGTHPEHLRLIHRPLKNWIKAMFKHARRHA